MHLMPLIHDLAIILAVAGIVSLIFQKIRQPVVLGYITAGIIVGPYTPPYSLVTDIGGIKIWAELGVIFLMFSLGLEFSFRKLASVGLSAGSTALFEVISMLSLGFLAGKVLGWSSMDSLFLGAMLSISSTTIIIKALDELKLKSHHFAEIIFGVLIVEDLVAILILVVLSTIAAGKSISGLAILVAAGKLVLVIGGWILAGYFIVPELIRYVSQVGNNEMMTIVSLALCLLLVVFSAFFEYSVALGAFIMGSILAESTESHRIEERMESLRDVFAAIFFVSVGMLIDPIALWHNKGAVAFITVITIIGKVLSTTIGALISGQTLRTSIQVGFGLTQIGEFSFIIAGLGVTLGVTSDFLYPVGVAVSLITTFTTPYMIRLSYRFAAFIETKIPNRVKTILTAYASWTQKKRADATRNQEFYQLLLRWVINGLIVSMIFVLSGEVVLPIIWEKISNSNGSSAASWLGTALISAPFIWGMLTTFKDFEIKTLNRIGPHGGALVISRLAAALWLGALSLEFFPVKNVIPIVFVLLFGLFVLLYKQIETSYHWLEKRFMQTFEAKEKSKFQESQFRHLAPWDAHLVRIKVHPNAGIVGKSIAESRIRTRFGSSIVAIQRGLKTIVAPNPNEIIFPKDELLLLGTDEQLDAIHPEIEKPLGLEDPLHTIFNYELKQILITETSSLKDQSIRASNIRENYEAMIVGIERADQRIMNPESDMKLKGGDTLWVVGEKEKLDQLVSQFVSEINF